MNKTAENRQNDLKKIIGSGLWSHRFRSLLSLAVIVLSIVLEVIPPLILAEAVDDLTRNSMISLALVLGYFVMLALSGFADALREGLIVSVGEGLTHALRSAMMAKLHRLPAAYFTEHDAGQIASIQVNDVDAIEDMFSSGIVSMFSDLGTVVATLIVVFTKSRGLGILLLVALPLLSVFTAHVQKKMRAAHIENRKATAKASGILPETMHIIRTLHVFRAERFAEKRYDKAIQNSFQAIERTNFYDAVYSPVILTVSAAVIGVMMSLSGQSGAFRDFFGMSVGTAVALIAYVNSIFTPLSSIGMEIQTVQSAAAGWKRVQTFLYEEERPEIPAERPDANAPIAVSIQDVTFSYDGKTRILNNVCLDVKKGEFVTLTGRTGVGKSTLFKLLLGLYEPDEGEIRIEGLSPLAFSDGDRRRTICCVEQNVTPVPGTIRDQVTLGNPDYSDEAVWRALDVAGLKTVVSSLPKQLDTFYRDAIFSQGQKQLLMIARAVVSDPAVLLLDEITAGLDSATEKVVLEALEKASEKRTVLSISHRLSEVMPGRIVEMTQEAQ